MAQVEWVPGIKHYLSPNYLIQSSGMLVVTCGYTDWQGRLLLKHVSNYGRSLLATLYTGIRGTPITLVLSWSRRRGWSAQAYRAVAASCVVF